MEESMGAIRRATSAGSRARRRWARTALRRDALNGAVAREPRVGMAADEDVGMQWAIAWYRNVQTRSGMGRLSHVAA